MDPLVSVITPCYNGEKYLNYFFQSLIDQTYKNLEIFFINDGSTDQTEEIALSFMEVFKSNGIPFTYLYHSSNKGQAAAINKGLQKVSGKYIVWPDSDDTLEPKSIEKRVRFLENNQQYGFVRSLGYYIDGKTRKIISSINFPYYNDASKVDIFLDLINEETYCVSGCYMVRSELLFDIYPERRIFESRAGQNWQILIPMAGRYRCGFIKDSLYNVTVHTDSHSRKELEFNDKIQRLFDLKEILEIGIQKANRYEIDYKRLVEIKYLHLLFQLYMSYEKKIEATCYYQKLKLINEQTEAETRSFLTKWHPVRFLLYRIIKRLRG